MLPWTYIWKWLFFGRFIGAIEESPAVQTLFKDNVSNAAEYKRSKKAEQLWDRHHWQSVIYSIAESDKFRSNGKSAIESALVAPFWECLFYLNYEKDKAETLGPSNNEGT